MKYTDLIFDLYGTLVDIRTCENTTVWKKTALFFSYYGANYTAGQLQAAFESALSQQQAGQSYECYPDTPVETVFAQLFRARGICENADSLGIQASQLFRIAATKYIRLYPGVQKALAQLRAQGYRLWLLSNAQRVFTEYELRHLGLSDAFNGIYISSDHGCRKPDKRFLGALMQEQNLKPENCLMIGNDRSTDIAGAQAAGLATLYLHTNITPPGQAPADPRRHPARAEASHHWELSGAPWSQISQWLCGANCQWGSVSHR